MHVFSTNQIADILHYNDNQLYTNFGARNDLTKQRLKIPRLRLKEPNSYFLMSHKCMMISSCIKCVKCESLVKRRFQKFHLEPEKLGPMALRIYALIQFYGFKFRLQVAFKFRYKFIKNNLREKHTYRILYKSFRNLVCRYLISHTFPSKPIICTALKVFTRKMIDSKFTFSKCSVFILLLHMNISCFICHYMVQDQCRADAFIILNDFTNT